MCRICRISVFVVAAVIAAAARASAAPDGLAVAVAAFERSTAEGNQGTTVLVVEVIHLFPVSIGVTRHYRTIDGTATAADNDYVAASGDLTIPAGQTSASLELRIVGDIQFEENETFTLEIENLSNSPLHVTILNDDLPVIEARPTGPVAAPIAAVVADICVRQGEDDFREVCQALDKLSDDELAAVLEEAAPQQSGAQSKVASEVASAVTSGIRSRLAALRSAAEGSIQQRVSVEWNGHALPFTAPGGESGYRGWSVFVSANTGSGERLARAGQLGFDLKSRGLMAGTDRRLGDNIIGVSVHWMELDSTLSRSAGSVDTTSYALSVYGGRDGLFAGSAPPSMGKNFRYDGVHIEGSVTAGRNRYDSEHVVEIPGLDPERATSRNDANLLAVSGVAGVDAQRGRLNFDLSFSGTWSQARVDDLTESGEGPLILFVEGYDVESLVGTGALNVRSSWPVPFGTLQPSLRAEFLHEFRNGARLVTARFLRDRLGTGFTIPIDSPDANYGKVSAGLQADFPWGYSAFVELTQDVLRSDLHFRTIQVNVMKSF